MSWAKMRRTEKLAWTQVFIDYPPIFPGFTMHMKLRLEWRDGVPAKYEKWTREAEEFSEAGFTPLLYAFVKECIRHEQRDKYHMEIARWAILPRAIEQGLELKAAVLGIYSRGPEFIEKRLRELTIEKRRREITRRVELELKQELRDLDNL